MQYKTLDQLIEKYLDEPNNKELKEIFNNTSELFKDVYIQMKRPIKNDKERKQLDDEKEILKEILIKKGYIKNEKQRTAPKSGERIAKDNEQQTTNNNLIDEYEHGLILLETLYDRLELLEEKQSETNSVKAVDYSKEKVKHSNKFDFNLNIIDEINLTEQAIKTQRDELKQQRRYITQLLDQFEPLESQVVKLNLFHGLTINEIAEQLNRSVGWCHQTKNKILKEIEVKK